MVAVSVVVPVFDPGPSIEPCIASLLAQTIGADELEIIFVDDGSTDGTAARLDALAAEHANVQVLHISNSGWPSRPRNLGIERATGEYVQFVDQDDYLAADALERLVAMGRRNDSDVVVGKVAGHFGASALAGHHAVRGIPLALFRKNRDVCTVADAPLVYSLTPHKMLRRSFIAAHRLSFPEGRRRIEDQLFMLPAFLAAERVSVLSDTVCYHYAERADQGNAGSYRLDPDSYFADVRRLVDIAVAATEPGPDRDRLLRRFYRIEMLGRLTAPWFPAQEPEFRERLIAAIRPIATDPVNDGVHAGLAPIARLRSTLLRGDHPADLAGFAELAGAITGRATVVSVGWSRGRLQVVFDGQFLDADGHPLTLERRADRLFLTGPLVDAVDGLALDVTDDVAAFPVDVSLVEATTAVEWAVTAKVEVTTAGAPDARPVARVSVAIDPRRAAVGGPIEAGDWAVSVRLMGLGFDRRVGVTVADGMGVPTLVPAWSGSPGCRVTPRFGADGALRICVAESGQPTLAGLLADAPQTPERGEGRTLGIEFGIAADPDFPPQRVLVMATRGGTDRSLTGSLTVSGDRIRLRARTPILRGRLPRGRHDLVARFKDDGPAAAGGLDIPLGSVVTTWDGRSYLEGAPRDGLATTLRRDVRRLGRGVVRRLPKVIADPLRRTYRRVRGATRT